MAESAKRWDADDRFTGVADASGFAPAVGELAALARRPGWVAEDPEVHLAPRLRGVSVPGMRIVEIRTAEDGVLAITAACDAGTGRGELRRRAWALLGTVAARGSGSVTSIQVAGLTGQPQVGCQGGGESSTDTISARLGIAGVCVRSSVSMSSGTQLSSAAALRSSLRISSMVLLGSGAGPGGACPPSSDDKGGPLIPPIPAAAGLWR